MKKFCQSINLGIRSETPQSLNGDCGGTKLKNTSVLRPRLAGRQKLRQKQNEAQGLALKNIRLDIDYALESSSTDLSESEKSYLSILTATKKKRIVSITAKIVRISKL